MDNGGGKGVSPAVAVIVILIVIGVVLAVGWAIFYLPPRPPAEEELAAKAIVNHIIAYQGKGDTAKCSIKAVGAQCCSERGKGHQPPITTYLAVDCEVTILPLKGTADKVIISPPDAGETYRERIVLLKEGKEIGHVTVPKTYQHGGHEWRVREVFLNASTIPAD
jgi:hypothetical protein